MLNVIWEPYKKASGLTIVNIWSWITEIWVGSFLLGLGGDFKQAQVVIPGLPSLSHACWWFLGISCLVVISTTLGDGS